MAHELSDTGTCDSRPQHGVSCAEMRKVETDDDECDRRQHLSDAIVGSIVVWSPRRHTETIHLARVLVVSWLVLM